MIAHAWRAMLLAAALPLAGCAPDAGPRPTAPATAVAPSPEPPPPAPLPPAADGSAVQSCADGRCEVRVTSGTEIPLPGRSRIMMIVASAGPSLVVLRGTWPGGSVSTGDSCSECSASVVGPSAGAPGTFDVTVNAGGSVTVNALTVVAVAVAPDGAVLRIGPA